ncbi:portal protein [Candidatus Poriferisocius sp.]|uniref:portal protein n=1 Tax=Candidatus Poriferisocius sp. TaxID=3101276 RepID=UPI003B524DED
MEDLQGVVTGMIQSSVRHYRSYYEGSDRLLTDLFRGERRDYGALGDLRAKEGRSGSMSTDIRDAVLHVLPRILETLLASMKVVRFVPSGPQDILAADAHTETVRHVIAEDNDGFLEMFQAVVDALVLDMGWVRYWWDEGGTPDWTTYRGLNEEQLTALVSMPGITGYDIIGQSEDETSGEPVFDCSVQKSMPGQVRIEAVPNDEMVYDSRARAMGDADCIAHVRALSADRVVAMGYDPEVVESYKGKVGSLDDWGGLGTLRDYGSRDMPVHEDDSRMVVEFADAWVRVDLDGDGVAELRHFHCIGPQYDILNGHGEPVSRVPVCQFLPIKEVHTMRGLGYGTLLADVQIQKSLLERGLMNAQARSLDPRMIVNEDAVRYEDLSETGLHEPIRVMGRFTVDEAIREMKFDYHGDAVLQGIAYLNDKRADRSGMARAAEGKDAAALQSTTQQAVSETFARADSMTILVIRMLAETGLRPLYKGISEMLMKHQGYVRRIMLDDGRFMDVDPRSWIKTRECRVNVRGWDTVREIEFLSVILQIQNQLMERNSPLVTEMHIGNTVRSLFRATGRTNVSDYLVPFGPEEQAKYSQAVQQMLEQQPPPVEQQVIDVEKSKMLLEDDREREKVAVDAALKELELEQKFQTEITREQIKANIEVFKAKQQVKAAKEMPSAPASK